MEDSIPKEQSSASHRSASRLLRYPLRSATKLKEEKPPLADSSNSSASKSARPASSVSKSVSVVDISGKEKSAKPPRRLSIPSKSSASSASKSSGNITPISKARGRRSDINNAKSDTPVSDVSRSSSRKKFSVLSSASYWLSQIKLSESANKHSVSLGFFKLALESGCEPMLRIKDELKSYVRRHSMSEFGESAKELLESYKIFEGFEQLQVSGTSSQVPSEVGHLTDDDVHCTFSTTMDADKLQPESVDIDANNDKCQVQKETKEMAQKKPRKAIKQESAKVKDKVKVKKQGRKATEGHVNSPPKEGLQEDKENMEVLNPIEDMDVTEV